MRNPSAAALLILLVLPLSGGGGNATRFVPAPPNGSGTEVTIKGTSTLHDWTMTGSAIKGSIETDPDLWRTTGEKPARVVVSIPVASIRSEHKKMDAIMQQALKTKAHPEIRYEIVEAEAAKVISKGFVVRTTGKLTIAGTTRDISMDIVATSTGDRGYTLTGEVPIHLPDYGIKPPTAMLGTVKTGPNVKVAFRWVVGQA